MIKSEKLEQRTEMLVGEVKKATNAMAHWALQFEHIIIEVRGNPAPRQAAKHFKMKDKIGVTSGADKASTSWIGKIHLALEPFLPDKLWDGPIGIIVKIQIYKPPSVPKRRIFPQVKPDLDNYLKNVLDALKGKVMVDDNQVVFIQATKLYGDPPQSKFMVFRIEEQCQG